MVERKKEGRGADGLMMIENEAEGEDEEGEEGNIDPRDSGRDSQEAGAREVVFVIIMVYRDYGRRH